MSRETEKFIRRAYQVTGEKDIADRVSLFTDDGAFAGESIEVVHRGPVRSSVARKRGMPHE